MSGLKFQIGGRTVSQSDFMKNIEESAMELAHKAVRERVLAVKCPVHRQSPTNFRVKRTGGKVEYEFTACCERLREAVKRALR